MRYGAALLAESAGADSESATADVPGSMVGSGSGACVNGVGAGGDCSGALCPAETGGANLRRLHGFRRRQGGCLV